MSKLITISDETAEILEQLVQGGRYADLSQAADQVIRHLVAEELEPGFLIGLEESIRQADEGLVIPLTDDLIHSVFSEARSRLSIEPR